jgi:hypothetical protein
MILDQKATPAVWLLPKNSQRAIFYTVGPVRNVTGQQKAACAAFFVPEG